MKLYIYIQNTFSKIEQLFDNELLEDFKNSTDDKLWFYHFTLGTWIRNNLLEKDGELYKEFVRNGCTDKDEMSAIIIEAFRKYQKTKPLS